MQSNYELILSRYWGYNEFRYLQDQIIESIGSGKDTLGLMPTGGGKSITFQVPALALPGLCLVITPLVALMRDQVEALRSKDIKATYIHSGMNKEQIITTLDNCIFGHYKFLYVSPERLSSALLIARLNALNINIIAVDEAHCISQWGYDFRPSFMKIRDLRNHLPYTPVLALTATATPEVVEDIQYQLQFREPKVFQKSFERKNLTYLVRHVNDKFVYLLKILEKEKGTAIVYTRSRTKAKEIALLLRKHHLSADYYHAGLEVKVKEEAQKNWMKGECRIMVSTNAFGMGIDKSDVRVVVHIDTPESIEAYFQEAGRAGRDGQRAYAVLLCNKNDSSLLKRRVGDTYPSMPFVKKVYDHLASYFQIAEGFGHGSRFKFELFPFSKNYKLNHNHVHNALKVLELEGYIEYAVDSNPSSLVQFTQSRGALYQLNLDSKRLDDLILCLLRSYSGIFTQLTAIDEADLSKRMELGREEVYTALSYLSKIGVIKYIPKSGSSFITYLLDRTSIEFSPGKYVARKNSFEQRINAVINYINNDSVCRSKFLLSYFGENQSSLCGECDICKEKNPDLITKLSLQIIGKLSESPISIHEINVLFPYYQGELNEALTMLRKKGKIKLVGNNIFLSS